MTLPNMPSNPVSREYVRIAGGYGAAALGSSPAGGLDIDDAGNLATNGDVTVEGEVTAGDVLFSGELRAASGGCDKTWSRFVAAKEIAPITAAGPTVVEFRNSRVYVPLIDFADSVQRDACFAVGLPADYDGTALEVTLYWTATGGTAGNTVLWGLQMGIFGDDENLGASGAGDAAFNPLDTFLGSGDVHIISGSITPSGAASGTLLTGYIRRFGSNATDTLEATARLIGIRLAYA